MEILLSVHGFLRWPVLLVLAAGLARALVGLRRPAPDRLLGMDRILASALVGSLDTQLVLGLVLVFVNDSWSAYRLHLGLMSTALILGHLLLVLVKKRPSRVLYLALFTVPTLLVLWGLRIV